MAELTLTLTSELPSSREPKFKHGELFNVLKRELVNLPQPLIKIICDYCLVFRFYYLFCGSPYTLIQNIGLGYVEIQDIKHVERRIVKGQENFTGSLVDLWHNQDYLLSYIGDFSKRTVTGIVKYHIPSGKNELIIYPHFFPVALGIYKREGLKDELYVLAFGKNCITESRIHYYNEVNRTFDVIWTGKIYRKGVVCKDGIYLFNCRDTWRNSNDYSCRLDYKTRQVVKIKSAPVRIIQSVLLNDRYILLKSDDQLYQYDMLLDDYTRLNWKSCSDASILYDFISPWAIDKKIICRNGMLFSFKKYDKEPTQIYYLQPPFEVNEWIGPIKLDCNVRIAS